MRSWGERRVKLERPSPRPGVPGPLPRAEPTAARGLVELSACERALYIEPPERGRSGAGVPGGDRMLTP